MADFATVCFSGLDLQSSSVPIVSRSHKGAHNEGLQKDASGSIAAEVSAVLGLVHGLADQLTLTREDVASQKTDVTEALSNLRAVAAAQSRQISQL